MNYRELDAKVAECLAKEVEWIGTTEGTKPYWNPDPETDGTWYELPRFSTTWEGMGVLVEEARKQGVYLEFVHMIDGFQGEARIKFGDSQNLIASMDEPVDSAPLAVTMAFLAAKGVDVTPYLEGVSAG